MNQDFVRRALVESGAQRRALREFGCRAMDVVVAALGLVGMAPLMVLAAIAVAVEGRGPILFAQERIGWQGRPFRMLKFRSMVVDADRLLQEHLARDDRARAEWDANHKLRNDPRITRLGRFLRSSSVDELPQLFNVLKGEMSIVGPRPIVLAEAARYGNHFSNYCRVRPGITGVWQVSGRSNTSYQRRVEMDAVYARHKSVLLDLRIILATIPAVLLRRGSY